MPKVACEKIFLARSIHGCPQGFLTLQPRYVIKNIVHARARASECVEMCMIIPNDAAIQTGKGTKN